MQEEYFLNCKNFRNDKKWKLRVSDRRDNNWKLPTLKESNEKKLRDSKNIKQNRLK